MVAVPLSAGVSGAWLCGNEGVLVRVAVAVMKHHDQK